MPVDMNKYPDNWKTEIRPRILRRAGGDEIAPEIGAHCEWCGVRNYDVGYRIDRVLVARNSCDSYKDALEVQEGWHQSMIARGYDDKPIIIVLTIAHLDDPDPMNTSDDNLAALCQKCHNDYDQKMRQTNAAGTRRQALIDAGQMELL